jgi:hypothetical protein
MWFDDFTLDERLDRLTMAIEFLQRLRPEDFDVTYGSRGRFRFFGNGLTSVEVVGGDLAPHRSEESSKAAYSISGRDMEVPLLYGQEVHQIWRLANLGFVVNASLSRQVRLSLNAIALALSRIRVTCACPSRSGLELPLW